MNRYALSTVINEILINMLCASYCTLLDCSTLLTHVSSLPRATSQVRLLLQSAAGSTTCVGWMASATCVRVRARINALTRATMILKTMPMATEYVVTWTVVRMTRQTRVLGQLPLP